MRTERRLSGFYQLSQFGSHCPRSYVLGEKLGSSPKSPQLDSLFLNVTWLFSFVGHRSLSPWLLSC